MPRTFSLGSIPATLSDDGKILTLTVDLSQRGGLSSTGKTVSVASTHGNVQVPGTDVKLGLNAYVKA